MKMFKKVVSAVTASALTLSMAAGSAAMFSVVTAADDIDSMNSLELVEAMGQGWNLGNSLDSTNTWTNPLTVEAIETAWKNPVTTQSIIDSVAFVGFDTIRVPVTWYQMMDDSGNINAEYMARVKEVVDYCYNKGLFVIVNVHHDGVEGNWLANGTSAQTKFENVWTQIATEFKDYDRHLVFEGWNETEWDYSTNLTMGQAFVDTVRATGGNNADRLLVIPGPNTNLDATLNTSFTLPEDSADMLAVDIHYYDPTYYTVYSDDDTPWTGVSVQNTWGTDEEVAKVKNDFLNIQSRFTDNGIGVIIGEYGVENYNKPDDQGRVLFTKTVASASEEATGICSCLWDSGGPEGEVGNMQYFDRWSQTWLNSEIESFYKELNGGTYVNEDGLILTDRITLTGTTGTTKYGDSAQIDIKALKDKAVIKEIIWNVEPVGMTDDGYYGWFAVQGNILDASDTRNWGYIGVSTANESNIYTTDVSDVTWYYNDADNDYAMTAYEGEWDLEYDYIKIEPWYVGSDGTVPTVNVLPDITVVFEEAIWVTSDYTIPEDETTEPTTEEDTTEEPTTEEPTTEPTTEGGAADVKYGDANNDGDVSVADVILVNQAYMKTATLDGTGAANADVDNDGDVDLTDSLNILKSLIDLVTLPIA